MPCAPIRDTRTFFTVSASHNNLSRRLTHNFDNIVLMTQADGPGIPLVLWHPVGAKRRWQDSHACTTSGLRVVLSGAYTGGESPMCVRFGRIGVALRCGCRDAVDRLAWEIGEVAENLLRGQVQTTWKM